LDLFPIAYIAASDDTEESTDKEGSEDGGLDKVGILIADIKEVVAVVLIELLLCVNVESFVWRGVVASH
jgi:hypothetical protein